MNRVSFLNRGVIIRGGSVSKSQVDIRVKYNILDIGNWKTNFFLDTSSTNTDTLVPSLYNCLEIWSLEVFQLLFQ
jgi:hypothetical protein